MNLIKPVIVVFGICLLIVGKSSYATNLALVRAHAWEARNGHIIVGFSLTNCGSEKISIEYGNLPWKQTFTTLTAYIGSGNFAKMLPSKRPIADYPSHIVYISPRTSKQGNVDLNFYIPSLNELNDYSDLIIFWSYELTDKNFRVLKTFGGMLTVGAVQSSTCGGA